MQIVNTRSAILIIDDYPVFQKCEWFRKYVNMLVIVTAREKERERVTMIAIVKGCICKNTHTETQIHTEIAI